ncbi:MAG: hypothetical protein IT374_08565 [Polyangiaceae bacterium]|nr:hypothetical protein [Polyangiaceae bacterium]
MRLASALALALLSGCRGQIDPPGERAAAPATSASAAPPASAAPAASSAPATAGAPPPTPITPTCCMRDRAEGSFGPEKGVNTRYVGEYLRRHDGERVLFPHDLVSDTKELYQHARSAGRSVLQERRLAVLGEGDRYVSVEITDKGETGALMPFAHSKCLTVDLKHGRALRLEDVLGKPSAEATLAAARARFDAAAGHEQYRLLPGSFALIGKGERRVRFCGPARRDEDGAKRLDVELDVVAP